MVPNMFRLASELFKPRNIEAKGGGPPGTSEPGFHSFIIYIGDSFF
jgi:hypothetical protein